MLMALVLVSGCSEVVEVGSEADAGFPGLQDPAEDHEHDAGETEVRPDARAEFDAGGGMSFPSPAYLCGEAPPEGAATPPRPPSYSGGSCPDLVPGMNRIDTAGGSRDFLLLYPEGAAIGEALPVVFFWHWLGGSANKFVERGELEAAVEEQRFIAVVPEHKGDVLFRWPFSSLDSEARLQEELGFFDDLLACTHDVLPVNEQCVVSAGVSAGALWTSQLAIHRSEYLSSMISLSGGTGGDGIRPWRTSAHKLPSLVLWGGPRDECVVLNFENLSRDLSGNLERDGHFLIECVHNCGHAVPPVTPVEGRSIFAPFWEFGFNHPYWLRDGESPYLETGLPEGFPSWCSIGRGSASMREGMCEGDSGC